jgi:hypothetical protein
VLLTVGVLGTTIASLIGARYAYLEAMRAQRYITGMLIAFESETVTARGQDARISDAADALVASLNSNAFAPTEEPDLRMVAGRMYELIGLYEPACAQYETAVAARSRLNGPTASDTLEALSSLARALMYLRQTQKSEDGIAGLASPDKTVAESFKLLATTLGWSDPRTIDALAWSAPSLDELRAAIRGLNAADLSEPVQATALCTVTSALLLRPGFGKTAEDNVLLEEVLARSKKVLRGLEPFVLEDIVLFIQTLLYKQRSDQAAQLIEVAADYLRHPNVPRSDWFHQRSVGWAAHRVNRSDLAREIYERDRTALLAIPANSRAKFEEIALYITCAELAQLHLARQECHLAQEVLRPVIDTDDSACSADARTWKATAFSALARACALCGNSAAGQAFAERARSLLELGSQSRTARRVVEEDLAAFDALRESSKASDTREDDTP